MFRAVGLKVYAKKGKKKEKKLLISWQIHRRAARQFKSRVGRLKFALYS
jgi:hypothetical protein